MQRERARTGRGDGGVFLDIHLWRAQYTTQSIRHGHALHCPLPARSHHGQSRTVREDTAARRTPPWGCSIGVPRVGPPGSDISYAVCYRLSVSSPGSCKGSIALDVSVPQVSYWVTEGLSGAPHTTSCSAACYLSVQPAPANTRWRSASARISILPAVTRCCGA